MTLRLLWLSDAPWGDSAYAKITWEITKRLQKRGHDVAIVPPYGMLSGGSVVFYGPPWDKTDEPIAVMASGAEAFSQDKTMAYYLSWNADVLITLKDTFALGQVAQQPLNWMPITMIETSPPSFAITNILQMAWESVVMSAHGQDELKRFGLQSKYIPCGVDTTMFTPPEDKARCRRRLGLRENEFVVLVVAMNRPRKLIPRMMRGFARFAQSTWTAEKDNPARGLKAGEKYRPENIRLFLWTDAEDTAKESIDLVQVMDLLGLRGVMTYPTPDVVKMGLPEPEMKLLYGACDVLLNCTGGEGVGLPVLEAAACGLPSIVTDYAASNEYMMAGYVVPVADFEYYHFLGTPLALTDVGEMAEAIRKVYENPSPERISARARRRVLEYDWDKIVDEQWMPYLADLEDRIRPLLTAEGDRHWELSDTPNIGRDVEVRK